VKHPADRKRKAKTRRLEQLDGPGDPADETEAQGIGRSKLKSGKCARCVHRAQHSRIDDLPVGVQQIDAQIIFERNIVRDEEDTVALPLNGSLEHFASNDLPGAFAVSEDLALCKRGLCPRANQA